MLERSEKGKQVRRYFIQVEKRYKMAQRAVVDQAEQLAAFMDRQEAFNRAVMDKLGSLELHMMEGSRRYPSRFFGSAMEERMKELNRLIDQVAVLTGMERNRVLHFMYNALQEHLGISLDPYLFIFREESGDENACPLHVIASNDRFYEVAVSMNQSVIDRKKLYG